MPIATKLGRMITSLDGLLPIIISHDPLIICLVRHEVHLQEEGQHANA